jgi:hypothetical protein
VGGKPFLHVPRDAMKKGTLPAHSRAREQADNVPSYKSVSGVCALFLSSVSTVRPAIVKAIDRHVKILQLESFRYSGPRTGPAQLSQKYGTAECDQNFFTNLAPAENLKPTLRFSTDFLFDCITPNIRW